MGFSELTIRVVLLFIPGIISYIIIDKCVTLKDRTKFHFVLYAFILGFLDYLTVEVLLSLSGPGQKLTFTKALVDNNIDIDMTEVKFASVVAILVGLTISAVLRRSLFHRFVAKLKISRKISDPEIWGHVFNSQINPPWVCVRDLANDLTYTGWVDCFSEDEEERAMFIREVEVKRNTSGEKLYDVPAIYLSKRKDNIIIEFLTIEYDEAINTNSQGDSNGEEY